MEALEKNSLAEVRTDNKELYQKNLEALNKHHPELVELVESLTIEKDRIKVFNSDTGQPRVLYKKDDGEEVFIHSSEDPTACANQAVDLLGMMEKEGIAVLFGFGLGYFAEEVFKRFEKGHILMVYEATPELFKTALMTRDLVELLESEKVMIFLGTANDSFSAIHKYQELIANGKFWIVKHHPSVKLNEEAYSRLFDRLEEEKRLSDSGVNTIVHLGKEFVHAVLANIPQIIRKQGVSKLKDAFKGMPAIIVSAGPSLEKNFHLLKKAKGKAMIIAVDVVLPTLLPAGIVPDILVAIDPVPANIVVFRDNPLLKNVPFICIAQYTPGILDIYPGPVFINSTPDNIVYQWLSSLWEDKGYIDCFGGSVAHFAFGVAEYIGADTIALTGQDLSFENKLHAGETSKLIADYQKEDEADYTKNGQEVEDVFGEKVNTLETLLVFRTSFENKIKTFEGTVVNATEGGLPIKGSAAMRLDDFINEYCDFQKIDTYSIMTEITEGSVAYDLDTIQAAVSEARDIFIGIKKNASRVLKLIKRIKMLKEKGHKDTVEFHSLLDKAETTIEEVKHPMLNLLVGYNYSLELFLKSQEMQEVDEIEDKWEKLDSQLERGSRYYLDLVKTINSFNKHLDWLLASLKREKEVNAAITDDSLPQVEKYSRAGMIYRKAGVSSQAAKYLEMALNTDYDTGKSQNPATSGFHTLHIPLAEMYIRQFRFYEARDLLEQIRDQGASGVKSHVAAASKAEELSNVCDGKIRDWESRKWKLAGMLKAAEDGYGSHLESGYFYFRVKDYSRSEGHYLKAIASHDESGEQNNLVEAYYGLAHTYLAIDDVENAVEVFEKAIEVDPDNPILYRDLGLIAFQNNNIESSELFFAKAIDLAPAEVELYKSLADLYLNTGQREKAIALYENALQTNADNPIIQQNLALIYKESIADTETG